jgi:hypothetical protein
VGGGSAGHGGGFVGGGISAGHGGGFVGGGVYRGGSGFRGYGGFYGGNRGYYGGYYGGYYNPYFYGGYGYGYGYGYSPYYSDYGYYAPADSYPVYQQPANVTMVYPQTAPNPVYVERPHSVVREYDEYGQPVGPPAPAAAGSTPASSPVYLIAFTDHTIRATAAYWVEGATLHFVTLEHEHRQAALSSVDRALSLQLNRERRVTFALPAGQ